MNKQEVFNKIADHLLKQMKVAIQEKYNRTNDCFMPTCAYRTSDGLKCAIGCLIPDELYKPEFEIGPIHSLLGEFPDLNKLFEIETPDDVWFLFHLQAIHDRTYPGNWRESLKLFAAKNNLTFER